GLERDPHVLEVVLEGFVADEPPGAVDHRQEEGREAEGDDDRREDERLRQRVEHPVGREVLSVGERGAARQAAGEQQEQVRRIAHEQDDHEATGQRPVEHEGDARGVHRAHGQDHDERRSHRRPPALVPSTSSRSVRPSSSRILSYSAVSTSSGSSSAMRSSSSTSWMSTSTARLRMSATTRPTTMRYTPTSKRTEDPKLTYPSTGSSVDT